MANLPTYGRNESGVALREIDTPLADFDNGMNLPASNAPGIGICTSVINPKLDNWTDPQGTQHIGGSGIGDGFTGIYYPVQAVQGVQNEDGSGGTDNNDTLSFIVALAQAAPGVGFGAANADPINRSDVTIEIGDRAWGTNTVA